MNEHDHAIDLEAIAAAIATILTAAGVDPADPVLKATPQRVAAAYAELFAGVAQDECEPLRRGDAVPPGTQFVALNGLEFRSVCAHHLLPFSGSVSVVYAPVERIVGIGSIIRSLEIVSTRPQLQEKLGQELAEALVRGAAASGALVIIQARHSCIADRGPREATSSMRTLAVAGDLHDERRRSEALTHLAAG